MRQVVYNILTATPSKVAGALGVGITSWSAGDPDGFRKLWGWAVTPEHIRIAGLLGLLVCVLYWALLMWLKPTPQTPATDDTFHNYGHMNVSRGDMHVHHHAPPPLPVKDRIRALLEGINPEILANIDRGILEMKIEVPSHVLAEFMGLIDNAQGRQYAEIVTIYGTVMGYMNEVGPGRAIRGVQTGAPAQQGLFRFSPLLRNP